MIGPLQPTQLLAQLKYKVAPEAMLTAELDEIEPVICSVPPLIVVVPLYELALLSSKVPSPLFTRFTLPVPLPCALLRITPANVQSAASLTVSVLSVFSPVLS